MSLLQEYDVDSMAVEEWLPWGGLTMPNVMQQKDGSCFSVIEYTPYAKTLLSKSVATPSFRRGWAMWSERQHTPNNEDKYCLVVCWNPFTTKNNLYIENTLGAKVEKNNFLIYFAQEINILLREIQTVTAAKLLEYQDLIDFLSFTLSMGKNKVTMPNIPLYMDALLSQDIDFSFRANDIFINGKQVVILTLPTLPETEEFFGIVKDVPFRYIRRMLLFDDTETKTELKKYAGKWCPLRKTMRQRIFADIVSAVNGYCYNGFIFQLESKETNLFRSKVTDFLTDKQIPFLFEGYNLKDTWWGSLPGIYLANITPPILGLPSIENLLCHKELSQASERQHRFRHLLDAMEKDNPDKKGVALEYVSDGQISS